MKDNTEYVMVSPDDTLILGTSDTVLARGNINCFLKTDEGETEIVWSGESTVWWDTQETRQRKGEALYVDDDGDEYTENECRLMTMAEFEALNKEYDYQNADEQVDESILANEYEFTEDGHRYRY
jgi:hypothetical protein